MVSTRPARCRSWGSAQPASGKAKQVDPAREPLGELSDPGFVEAGLPGSGGGGCRVGGRCLVVLYQFTHSAVATAMWGSW